MKLRFSFCYFDKVYSFGKKHRIFLELNMASLMKTYSRKKSDSPNNVIIHLNELCRLCLAKEDEMVHIFDEDAIPLPLRIMACVNLEVILRSLS